MNTATAILSVLALAAAIWALAGLFNPQALYFALPHNRTRKNAFLFPLRIAIPFAMLAYMEVDLAGNINHNWGATLGIGLAFLWYAGKRVVDLAEL